MGLFGEASSLSIAGFFVTIISFVLHLIGFSTPLWNYQQTGLFTLSVKSYNGLWQSCADVLGITECSKFNCDGSSALSGCTDQWKAAQAMEVLAFLVFLAASVLVILNMCILKGKPEIRLAAIGCCFAAGTLALMGIIIYASESNVKSKNTGGSGFHFSFAITIIAAIGGCVAGGLLIAGK